VRPGSITPKENSILTGRGQWQDGSWRVIIKRALSTSDPERDAQLKGGKIHVSFAVWDGSEDDRGSRKSISEWVILQVGSPSDSVPPLRSNTGAVSQSAMPAWPKIPAVILKAVVTSAITVPDQPARLETDPDEPEPVLINILAKRFVYNPSEITVQKGQLVTIRMESLDVTHGLYIDGYGIDIKARPGIIGKATFLADKTGRFTFRCSETCGEFHPYMIGYLNVGPNRRYHLFVVVALGAGLAMAALILLGKKSKGATSNE
jgi:plastocyanin